MNQILITKNKTTSSENEKVEFAKELSVTLQNDKINKTAHVHEESPVHPEKKRRNFQIILFVSIFIILSLVGFFMYLFFDHNHKDKLAKTLSQNYEILRLYSTSSSLEDTFTSEEGASENTLIGKLEIPAISLNYSFFSHLDENSLAISPCRFYGELPPHKGNLCIAGHNYDNGKFFSSLPHLKKNDEIIISDNSHHRFIYRVQDTHEVKADDLSPIYFYDSNVCELTLITCNNINQNRLVVKALLSSE